MIAARRGRSAAARSAGWVPLAWLAVLALLVALVAGCSPASSRPTAVTPTPTPAARSADPFSVQPPGDWAGGTVRRAALPPEARATLALIAAGGPYPYAQDDGVFGNREGLLPRRPSGSYREFTVETPGSPDRGARRLVVGEGRDAYYTDDHYDSFRFVVP